MASLLTPMHSSNRPERTSTTPNSRSTERIHKIADESVSNVLDAATEVARAENSIIHAGRYSCATHTGQRRVACSATAPQISGSPIA
jgi:hypothetical protein